MLVSEDEFLLSLMLPIHIIYERKRKEMIYQMTLEEELEMYQEYLIIAKRFEQFPEILRYAKRIEEIQREIDRKRKLEEKVG